MPRCTRQLFFWASWADAFTDLSVRDAPFLQSLAQALDARNLSAGTPIRDLLAATDVLVAAGFRMLLWADLPQHAPAQPADDAEPEVALRGWQRPASRALDDVAFAEHRHSVGPAELAPGFTVGPICSQGSLCASYCS